MPYSFYFTQVNSALTLNRTNNQWVDLGIHTEACMTRPETCGAAGGAISLWINVIECPINGGIISSRAEGSSGSRIVCRPPTMRYGFGIYSYWSI